MFSLTQQERQVILFLAGFAFLGLLLKSLTAMHPPAQSLIALSPDIGKVDLNNADKELLMSISGIGEKLACRILQYRAQNGAFTDLEELKNIPGITTSRFNKIKNSIIIRQ